MSGQGSQWPTSAGRPLSSQMCFLAGPEKVVVILFYDFRIVKDSDREQHFGKSGSYRKIMTLLKLAMQFPFPLKKMHLR